MNERVLRGLHRMLEARAEALARGEAPVGWKIGFNVPPIQQRLGIDAAVVAFLTSGGVVRTGTHSLAGAQRPLVEPEVAVHLGADVAASGGRDAAAAAIAALGPALEVVDMPTPPDDVEEALAGNVFHRAVRFGKPVPGARLDGVAGRFGDQTLDARASTGDPAEVVLHVASLLEAAGSRLSAGECIIAGSMTVPVPVAPGDRVALDLGPLGAAELAFTA